MQIHSEWSAKIKMLVGVFAIRYVTLSTVFSVVILHVQRNPSHAMQIKLVAIFILFQQLEYFKDNLCELANVLRLSNPAG